MHTKRRQGMKFEDRLRDLSFGLGVQTLPTSIGKTLVLHRKADAAVDAAQQTLIAQLVHDAAMPSAGSHRNAQQDARSRRNPLRAQSPRIERLSFV